MPTDLENLQAARSAIIEQLAVMDPAKMDYSIDGQSVSYSAYHTSLMQRLGEINKLIEAEQGPFQVDVRGVVA